MTMNDGTQRFLKFIRERHAIYERRQLGAPKPWTKDPILQAYRFCNVYRELDTQTIWFAKNWRKAYADDEDLWFASLLFRLINWHETAAELRWLRGGESPWGRWAHNLFVETLDERAAAGKKVYNGAYMISTHRVKQKKSEYLAAALDRIWSNRKKLRYVPWSALATYHATLMGQFDVGSFIAGQVIADCKYAGKMTTANDWWSFSCSGPGSRRGLSRLIYGSPKPEIPWQEEDFRHCVRLLMTEHVEEFIAANKMPKMHAQDIQNCLCEFDKYERVRLGESHPKAKYNGNPKE